MTPRHHPALADAFPEAVSAGLALAAAGLTVGVAESCTGGLVGAALTAVPGSSAYVQGGVVAYADRVKMDLLGVDAAVLASHGAVSVAVAEAMAGGVRRLLGCDIGLSVTGVAGPGSAPGGKPSGLVYVAVAGPGGAMLTQRLDADHGREANRAAAVRAVLRLCRDAAEAAR